MRLLPALLLWAACTPGTAVVLCDDGSEPGSSGLCSPHATGPGGVVGGTTTIPPSGGTSAPTGTTDDPTGGSTGSSLDAIDSWQLAVAGFAWDPERGEIIRVTSLDQPLEPTLQVTLLAEGYAPLCTFALVRPAPFPSDRPAWADGAPVTVVWSGADLADTDCDAVLGGDWSAIVDALPTQEFGVALRPASTELAVEVMQAYFPDTADLVLGFTWYHSGLIGADGFEDGAIPDGGGFGFHVADGEVVYDGKQAVPYTAREVGSDAGIPPGWYQLFTGTYVIQDPSVLWR